MKKDILKSILFLLFIRISILVLLTIMAMGVFLFLYLLSIVFKPFHFENDVILETIGFGLTTIFAIFAVISVMYIPAKIFGIFKIMEKYGLKIELTILIILSILIYLVINHTGISQNSLNDFGGIHLVRDFIFAWLFRKFFNFLTKKFPTPFKQIGYFFSIEFYKDLYKKLLNKSKPSD